MGAVLQRGVSCPWMLEVSVSTNKKMLRENMLRDYEMSVTTVIRSRTKKKGVYFHEGGVMICKGSWIQNDNNTKPRFRVCTA